MADETFPTGAELVAELNDLLALDHDAVQAYSLAIGRISSAEYRETLAGFRADHQRHIERLAQLIRDRGGVPLQLPHIPTGVFKAAVQALGTLGDDRATLLAFKTNEGQVRDKYRRHADRPHDTAVSVVLRGAAADEERHYAWVEEVVEHLGAGPGTLVGTAQQAAQAVHGRTADAIESAGRRVAETVEQLRPGGAE
ncbi:ferritin-like domain-containing protein [Longimicrobium sp.]|uniref:ferritin-like domain-containing protein n=1 Tax=Longimicrobium sp. TaxID=2029185 RepID=UPI002C275B17|nr:ferritin-like domain-containing protein [Longimicrobium sp.]HSU14750.1 ferritin-like domain-containing protein [Longimicrobium sp.]